MTRPIKMLLATATLGAALAVPGVVHAAADATLNKCWGQITKEFQAFGEPGMGDHASAHSFVTPTPTALGGEDEPSELGRRGVGNVSKEDHGDLSEGGQGEHAIAVAPSSEEFQSSLPEECQDSDMP